MRSLLAPARAVGVVASVEPGNLGSAEGAEVSIESERSGSNRRSDRGTQDQGTQTSPQASGV